MADSENETSKPQSPFVKASDLPLSSTPPRNSSKPTRMTSPFKKVAGSRILYEGIKQEPKDVSAAASQGRCSGSTCETYTSKRKTAVKAKEVRIGTSTICGFQSAGLLIAPNLKAEDKMPVKQEATCGNNKAEPTNVITMLMAGQADYQKKLKEGDPTIKRKPSWVPKSTRNKMPRLRSDQSIGSSSVKSEETKFTADFSDDDDIVIMGDLAMKDIVIMGDLAMKETKGVVEDSGIDDFIRLPDEILVNILCRLPIMDVMLNCSVVCRRWYRIISDIQFIPWKKLYYKIYASKAESDELKYIKELMLANQMKDVSSYLPNLIRYMANFRSWPRYKDVTHCLVPHPHYTTALCLLKERFSELLHEDLPNPWCVVACLCILCSSVHDLMDVVACLQRGSHNLQAIDITELLYAIATFFLCFKKIQSKNVWSGMHYRLHYAIYQFENSGPGTVAGLRASLTGKGQQSLEKYSEGQLMLTHEQMRICKFDPLPGQTAKIVAFAGTGKTSTLVRYTQLRPNKSFLLLVFNKSVQLHAQKIFPTNVKCQTSHSLAYQHVGNRYSHKLNFGLKVQEILNLVEDKKGMNMFLMAKFVQETLNNFLVSADEFITTAHTPSEHKDKKGNKVQVTHEQRMGIAGKAEGIWHRMRNIDDKAVRISHDGYLKLYQLSKPILSGYDVILVDEAQDLSPSVADIIKNQVQTKILVGDPNQQIYSFRGAVNSMSLIPSTHTFYLTQSFRFGPEIAYVANCALEYLKGEKKVLVGNSKVSTCKGETKGQIAIIARTNFELFRSAVSLCSGESVTRVAFVGGIDGYGYKDVLNICHLLTPAEERSDYVQQQLKNTFVGRFKGLNELESYADSVMDKELQSKIKIVRTFTHSVPGHIEKIKSKCTSIEQASHVLTTAHKSKGLEFDTVKLTSDYCGSLCQAAELCQQLFPEIIHGHIPDDGPVILPSMHHLHSTDEENLLYVALTRAKKSLYLVDVLENVLFTCGEMFISCVPTSAISEPTFTCRESGQVVETVNNSAVTLKRNAVTLASGTSRPGGYLSSAAAWFFHSLSGLFGTAPPRKPDVVVPAKVWVGDLAH